jgi:hypothetical protein
MFAMLYQWRIIPGSEDAFVHAWARRTEMLVDEQGSWGSRLHRTTDGRFIAYAMWPDRATWANADQVPPGEDAARLRAIMRSSAVRLRRDLALDLVEDHLRSPIETRIVRGG